MKNIYLLFISCFILFASLSYAQTDVNSVLDYTLNCRGLTREDITIPIEFFSAAEKSPTNDSKLILPLVKDMMVHPLRSMTWLDTVMSWKDLELKPLVRQMFKNANFYQNDLPYCMDGLYSMDFSRLVQTIRKISVNNAEYKYGLIHKWSNDDIEFLHKNLLSILEESDNDDESNFDIFKYNQARDSSDAITKRTMDLLSILNTDSLYLHSMQDLCLCYSLYHDVQDTHLVNFSKQDLKYINNEHVTGDFYYYYDQDGIRIAIGGPGKNVYNGKFDFIIDVGGDDVYNIENDKDDFGGFRCIIDLGGNDIYRTKSSFALAGGLFSSSFIFDKEGDDTYEASAPGNLGAAIGGLGLIYDESGNDTYRGLSFCEGAGCFGVGLLVDRKGNDVYIANSYAQGFGFTEGVGAIVENEGNDSYIVDARSLDIGRYNDHYVSMCQGYGLGLRPYYAGGIGLLIDGGGNDIYNCDIFGQGGGYWYSIGALVDKSGHDKYNGYQYCQGAGIHLAIGLLKDYDGWDFYQSDGVSQGCGHDFGFGLLWDVKGNDNYSAYSLSQGAGNADGIGMLIDESGIDGYLNKDPRNTRGYGNPRREYGSIGVLMDMSGNDFYSQPGPDSTIILSSTWGVANDYGLEDLPSQFSGNNFKVPLDTKGNEYSVADYFMMAKTIEPRFSLWQDYGFKKLAEDSINSAQYTLTRLGTDDARETQVMRVLSQTIRNSLSNALIDKLNGYIDNKSTMTQPEVSFACYIFGETRNPAGKDILLQLTNDNNYRVRASAINALGKIKYDTTDITFVNKVSSRLAECVSEKSEKKLYNKDLAFALGNYKTPESFKALMNLLDYPYYGARFTAADNLKKFPQLSIMLTDKSLPQIPQEKIPLIAFMMSLTDVKESVFRTFIDFIKVMPASSDEAVDVNILNIIKLRKAKSTEPTFTAWCDNQIKDMQGRVSLKVLSKQN